MLIFLDTEFTDFIDCELISLGMVSEDGQRELYIEVADFDEGKCNPYVRANIWPQLGKNPEAVAPKGDVSARLHAFLRTLPRSVTVACDSETDCALLLDSLGERPQNLQRRYDLRTLIDTPVYHRAVLEYHAHPCRPWHHALHDARAHRAGWMAYMADRARKRNER